MRKIFSNLLGWRTNRKIVVIESDDWGSFRFKDAQTRDKFLSPAQQKTCWMSYNDSFESAEDIQELFKVLNSNKDKNNESAKFTFLMNPSNPDFKKIRDSNFTRFYNEHFIQTLEKRKDGEKILNLYKDGLNKNIIEIGFHGREHLNVHLWMNDLQKGDKAALLGFENNMWGFSKSYFPELKQSYRSTFDMSSLAELPLLVENIREGLQIINKTFDQKTTYFLAPDGPYHLTLNKELSKNGVKYIGLPKLHQNPTEKGILNTHLFWIGKRTKAGLTIITRNVIFEPSSPRKVDCVMAALSDIKVAFKSKKPAIISSHRANYIGSLNKENRTKSLAKLSCLLNNIVKMWPEVEFMTSTQLGELIRKKHD